MSKIRLEGTHRAVVEGRLALDSLMQFKRLVESDVPHDRDLEIDLSGVQVEDSAILALLVFMTRRGHTEGVTLTFTGFDDRISRMVTLAGIEDLINLKSGPDAC